MTIKTLNDHIEITPGVSGGKPRISGHRITVKDIVIWYDRMGKSADEIASEYNLNLSDIHAALTYYFDHREEINRYIEEDRNFAETLRKTIPSKAQQKLNES
jgi:uncharacterized protein (DUF433 family)